LYQIDVATASPTLPAPAAAGTPGYFTDGQVPNIPPTVVPADFMNAIMLELLNVLAAAGIAPSKTADNQLATAIRTIVEATAGNYAVDTGAANAYVVALVPPVANYTESFEFKFRAVHANTGASQVSFGPGNVPLTRDDGSALQQGDILANSIVAGAFDAVLGKAMISSIVPSQLSVLAKAGIGAGMKLDGTGNLTLSPADNSIRVTANGVQTNELVQNFTGTVQVNGAAGTSSHTVNFVGFGTLDVAETTTLWDGFNFSVDCVGGSTSVVPNAADSIGGQAAGVPYVMPAGTSALFISDGAGNIRVLFQTVSPTFSPAPQAITASGALGAGSYAVDTSGGPITITQAGLAQGQTMVFSDPRGTWGTNNFTLNLNGLTYCKPGSNRQLPGPLVWNTPGETFTAYYDGTTIRIS